MNLLCEPCSFPTDNQNVFGRAGLNLGKNEMCRALCQAGYQSFVFRIVETIRSSGEKGTIIYMVSKCNVFLPFVA